MTDTVFWLLCSCVTILLLILKQTKARKFAEKRNFSLTETRGNESVSNNGAKEREMEEEVRNKSNETMVKVLKGPRSLPFIGSLHLLRAPGGPFEAFTNLAKLYGNIYQIQLGVAKCVVVSSYDMVKEVLITKGSHFGGRPDFIRFHKLFNGDRNNSLALCDWSDLQRKRRSLARSFCSPRGGSFQLEELTRVAYAESFEFLKILKQEEYFPNLNGQQPIKPLMLAAAANMFTGYMCSTRFGYNCDRFNRVISNFDKIFWDINQGYAVDFMPWLSPFYSHVFKRLHLWTSEIRDFILDKIVNPRRGKYDENIGQLDFTDNLLIQLESPDSDLTWEHIIFELEDFIGGHSAIGNLAMIIFAYAVIYPEVQKKIQDECDEVLARTGRTLISLDDKKDMPYTEAVMWETLRANSSPIVPHVATQDTEVGGYVVKKDTVVFINNYQLNLGEEYWGPDSRAFRPERFLKSIVDKVDGQRRNIVVKPNFFFPFSTGKRTCIGQKLVQGLTFVLVSTILSNYDVFAVDDVMSRLQPGLVALPPETFHLKLKPRK